MERYRASRENKQKSEVSETETSGRNYFRKSPFQAVGCSQILCEVLKTVRHRRVDKIISDKVHFRLLGVARYCVKF